MSGKTSPQQALRGTRIGGSFSRGCFAGELLPRHKSALTFASQIAKVESLPNPGDFGSLVRGLNVYGYQTMKPTAVVLAQYA